MCSHISQKKKYWSTECPVRYVHLTKKDCKSMPCVPFPTPGGPSRITTGNGVCMPAKFGFSNRENVEFGFRRIVRFFRTDFVDDVPMVAIAKLSRVVGDFLAEPGPSIEVLAVGPAEARACFVLFFPWSWGARIPDFGFFLAASPPPPLLRVLLSLPWLIVPAFRFVCWCCGRGTTLGFDFCCGFGCGSGSNSPAAANS